jgi:uncharacterized protein YndB with AHSA1/START domain
MRLPPGDVPMQEMDATGNDTSYSKSIHIMAPIESVFTTIATLEGIDAWWDGSVSGNAAEQAS